MPRSGHRSVPRRNLPERRWDEIERKFGWNLLSRHEHLAEIKRQHELLAAQPSVGVAVRQRPDLRERLIRHLRLQQNAARLSAGEEATASLVGRVEQLREFEFRRLRDGPLGGPKRKI